MDGLQFATALCVCFTVTTIVGMFQYAELETTRLKLATEEAVARLELDAAKQQASTEQCRCSESDGSLPGYWIKSMWPKKR